MLLIASFYYLMFPNIKQKGVGVGEELEEPWIIYTQAPWAKNCKLFIKVHVQKKTILILN